MITRPLLAPRDIPTHINYPVLATPKLDGIRAIKQRQVLSRTFKPIRNEFIQEKLKDLPDGLDGELVSGTFNESQSGIMSFAGEPDFKYYIFDYVTDLNRPYKDRVQDYLSLTLNEYCVKLTPVLIKSKEELDAFETLCLKDGYEGCMVRDPHGRYKCGRGTLREGILLKIKRFEDSEAIILDKEELMHNGNPEEYDEFGLMDRSTSKDNLVPAGVLGAIIVKDLTTGVEFSIGTGFDFQTRKDLWDKDITGKIITYKFQPAGIKEKPRFPVFKGFRHEDDI